MEVLGTYTYVSVVALFCYVFLFMTLLAAQKNRIIKSFLLVLGAMILWTGGSFMMRMQFRPSTKVWYDVSIFGLLLLGYALYNFAYMYTGSKRRGHNIFWFVVMMAMNIVNITTGAFLAAPQTVTRAEKVDFIYTVRWPVVFLFIFCAAIVLHMFQLLFRYFKRSEVSPRQFSPILLGIGIMFLGHIAFVIPLFSGVPVDIIAGVLNACCLFYALYRRRLFRMTLLASRGSCYALSAGASILIFINLLEPIERFFGRTLGAFSEFSTLFTALSFTAATCLIYFLLKRFIDSVFVADENNQAEILRAFSEVAAGSLQLEEILDGMVDVIRKAIAIKRVYICLAKAIGSLEDAERFQVAHSTSPLDRKTFSLGGDNPVVRWMLKNDGCLIMSEFRRTTAYRSMWEKEKKALDELGIECIAPLKDQEQLVGLVLLGPRERSRTFTYGDVSFLSSVNSIATIAVKNSRLYEKAYWEARTDELTGLLNRKYFFEQLGEEYEACKDQGLALIIANLDDFKLYNQLYGNKEGDLALQRIAKILKSCVGENGYVARYGGKEFGIILPRYDMLSAKKLAEGIRRQVLSMNKAADDYSLKALTVSIGICALPYAASTVKQLVDHADMAVYHVKHHGKNGVMCYTNGDYPQAGTLSSRPADKSSIYSEYENTIYALTAAIDTKDHYTFSHSNNVAKYATALARAARLNPDHVEMIREAALLHDIGKIGVSEHILNKPGKLTEEEFEAMKKHVENSIGIIRHLPSLDYVIPAVIGHHERYDGQGYPRRIAGEDIPLGARILCIADSFDAMTTRRSYKPAYSTEHAVDELMKQAGTHFDPKLAPLFVSLVRGGVVRTDDSLELAAQEVS